MEDLRLPLGEAIRELAEELPHAFGDVATTALQLQLHADGSQALAIMGERGGGKTTLLTAVCGDLLREGRHLVLPIMRPELFGATDSIIATFLAELWDLVTREAEEEQDADGRDGGATIRVLAEAARNFAIGQTTTGALEHGTESPTDYAEDLLLVSRSRVRLTKQLRAVARDVCRPLEPKRARLIVVPIDDPDLSRVPIPDILTDLQVLGAIPGVVPIACFARTDLRDAWMDRKRGGEDEGSDDLNFMLARQLEKVFPYRCRFEIEPIADSARPDFSPVGENLTLAQKFERLHNEIVDRTRSNWNLDDAFMRGAARFELPSPLPSNARTLVQLWESLAVGTDAPGDETIYLTLRRVLDILTERLATSVGAAGDRVVHIGPGSQGAKRTPAIHPINANLTVRGDSPFGPADPGVASIQLRRIRFVLGVPSTGERDRRVKPEALVQLLSMQELVFGSGMYEISDDERLTWLGMTDWTELQRVELGGRSTDDCFVLLPDATTFSEVVRSVTLWNEMVDLCGDGSSESTLATAVHAACLTVDSSGVLVRDDDYEEAFARAVRTYKKCSGVAGSTARAYVRWFARDLPFQWHSGLLSPDLVRRLCAKHARLVENIDPSVGLGGPRTTSVFDQRIKLILDARDPQEDDRVYGWIGGYFDLAAARSSEHLDELSEIYRAWHRDVTGYRAGAAAAEFVTRSPRSRARARLAPYERPEGTALLAAALKALERAAPGNQFQRR